MGKVRGKGRGEDAPWRKFLVRRGSASCVQHPSVNSCLCACSLLIVPRPHSTCSATQ